MARLARIGVFVFSAVVILAMLMLPAAVSAQSSVMITAESIHGRSQILTQTSLPLLFPSQSAGERQARVPSAQSSTVQVPYRPITSRQRVRWFVISSVGPQSLAAGLLSAGLGTALDRPIEYGPHWEGFGKRYGMRLTGIVTGNAMEAGIGALWGEDPRYFRTSGQPFRKRIKNVIIMTVAARGRDGDLQPAYARYIATAGNNFLSNAWRVESESTVSSALGRTALGFAGRMASNAFQEFLPDLEHHVLHRPR